MSEMIDIKVDAKQLVIKWMSSNSFIQVNKSLLRKIGDTNTILLSESIRQYERWADKDVLQPDGSFYWTQMDCEIETGYSRSTQQRAFKVLEKHGLLKAYSKQIQVKNSDKKSLRFVKLNFSAIAKLMTSDDSEIIEEIKKKHGALIEKNQESRKKEKENSVIEADQSLDMPVMVQNESSQWFKMNHRDDSNRITSKKDKIIKKDKFIKKDLKNLSILDSVKQLEIPQNTSELLEKQIDRLILLNVNLLEIELVFKEFQSKISRENFDSVLYDVLQAKKINTTMKKYLTGSINNFLTNQSNKIISIDADVSKQDESSYESDSKKYNFKKKPVRDEMVPEWMGKPEEAGEQEAAAEIEIDLEKKRWIEENLKKMKA